MTDNSKYNNRFTADDIERYHSGKMSPIEMHQLEKAAMEDPFLADALEGYAYTQTPAEDRVWLQSQLQSKTEGAKVVPMAGFNRGRFLKIAAMFVLLIGCAWGVYQFGFKTRETDLAVSKMPAAETATPLREDTTPAGATLNQSAQNADANTKATIGTDDTNVSTQQTTVEYKGNGTVALSTQNRHTGRISGNEEEKTASLRKLPFRAKDLEAATITSAEESTSSKIDSNANKQDQLDKDLVATAPQTVTPGKENVIVLQRNKNAEPIPEVILGNKSMKDSTYRKPVITFEEAVPEKGSKYFDDYVAQNLQLPEEELRKNISGEVKLSFDVNASGEAVNIAIVKSLCTECDKEAIRLLQQGPKWVKKKNEKKGTVSIKF
jgi:TonB family protein